MKEQCLDIVRQKCNGCKGCTLAATRKNIVFGDGKEQSPELPEGELPKDTVNPSGEE